jgi:hypothetical protein
MVEHRRIERFFCVAGAVSSPFDKASESPLSMPQKSSTPRLSR